MMNNIGDMSWRVVADCQNILGEGPLWMAPEQALWWLDIERGRIYRWNWPDGPVQYWQAPLRITAIAPRAQGGFVAATERGFALFDTPDGFYHLIGNPEAGQWRTRFNDGAIDREGHFWAGSMDITEKEPRGSLYRLAPDLGWTRADSGYHVSNGPVFSADGRHIYINDSARGCTFIADIEEGGCLLNKRIFLEFSKEQGAPDGMAVDSTGALWIAFWDGACIRRYAPDAHFLQEIALPFSRPTSLAFGGPDYDWLFITSAQEADDAASKEPKRYAGALLAVHTDVQGLACIAFAG